MYRRHEFGSRALEVWSQGGRGVGLGVQVHRMHGHAETATEVRVQALRWSGRATWSHYHEARDVALGREGYWGWFRPWKVGPVVLIPHVASRSAPVWDVMLGVHATRRSWGVMGTLLGGAVEARLDVASARGWRL